MLVIKFVLEIEPGGLLVYLVIIFFVSSPVRKYRKSYCSHPGVGVGVSVGVAQNVKVFG